MNLSFSDDDLLLYRSLFRAREDVFAVRWEKGSKSGYMPAYRYDPYFYRAHRMKGGTFQNYPDKTFLQLSNEEIRKHLIGKQFIGIYPLLIDNTSWFIVADFDQKNWEEECRRLISACSKVNIPAYLERSRSGKGGHVWIFFEQAYPAVRSRKILISLLEQSGGFSIFDKDSSFDRLFPNQDFHSGKGLGNLIALPLYQPLLNLGNNCFVDPDTLKPYPNQWDFLKAIRRVPISRLDEIFESLREPSRPSLRAKSPKPTDALNITLDNVVRLNRSGLNSTLVDFLKEELNFANAEFFVKRNAGKSTWKMHFHIVLETLDTEEVTYVWHLPKDRERLRDFLQTVDKDLATIRNEGRHPFLEKAPNNFSRIIHNYSDERKGFIVWRDMLEERLF